MKPRCCLSSAMAGQPCLGERALSIRSLARILKRLVSLSAQSARPAAYEDRDPGLPPAITLPLTPADP